MKILTIVFVVLVVSTIVTLKLITSPGFGTSSDTFSLNTSSESVHSVGRLDSNKYDEGRQTYKDVRETRYQKSNVINEQKLMAFVKAYVEVQSYMNAVGNRANYKDTRKIVQANGLSVEEYTEIAALMNKDQDFRNSVRKIVSDAGYSTQ